MNRRQPSILGALRCDSCGAKAFERLGGEPSPRDPQGTVYASHADALAAGWTPYASVDGSLGNVWLYLCVDCRSIPRKKKMELAGRSQRAATVV